MSYQPGIPTGSIPLNQDYLNIQQNFTQINDQWEEDHVPLTSTSGIPPNGYHTAIHLVPVSTPTSNPPNNQPINGYTATPGYGQIFDATINDGINTDTALYFLTGNGGLQQLTRNFVPRASANGFTFLPGGLILQWGIVTTAFSSSASKTGTVTFSTENMAFPNACFSVLFTMIGNSSSGQTIQLDSETIPNPTKTGFVWRFTQAPNGTSYTGFYWTAVGN
jgi:hypothetical protein